MAFNQKLNPETDSTSSNKEAIQMNYVPVEIKKERDYPESLEAKSQALTISEHNLRSFTFLVTW